MRVCWPTDKAILDPATGSHVQLPAGTPYEMPDEEAQDRIRQGDCVPYVEPQDRPEPVDDEALSLPPVPPPGALTGQQIQEG